MNATERTFLWMKGGSILMGSLTYDDEDGKKKLTSLKKSICVLSNFTVSMWTRSICQMQKFFPGVEFLRTLYWWRMENSPLYVHVLQETLHQEVSCRGPACSGRQ